MSENPFKVHRKATNINQVLPPVAELLADLKHTTVSYRNLDREEKQLDFRELTAQDRYPIPMPVDREGYGLSLIHI